MLENETPYPVDPDLDIAVACEGIGALVAAVESLFDALSSAVMPCAERTAIPLLLGMIDGEIAKIDRARRLWNADGGSCRA